MKNSMASAKFPRRTLIILGLLLLCFFFPSNVFRVTVKGPVIECENCEHVTVYEKNGVDDYKHDEVNEYEQPLGEEEEVVKVELEQDVAKHERPEIITIIRLVTNDVIPKFKKGTSFQNLKYLLYHEHQMDSVKRVWVLDRIKDPEYLKLMSDKLTERNEKFVIREYENTNSFEKSEESDLEDLAKYTYRNMKFAQRYAIKKVKNPWFIISDMHHLFTEESIEKLKDDIENTPLSKQGLVMDTYALTAPSQPMVINSYTNNAIIENQLSEGLMYKEPYHAIVALHTSFEGFYGAEIKDNIAMRKALNCEGTSLDKEGSLLPNICQVAKNAYSLRLFTYPNHHLPNEEGDKFESFDSSCSPWQESEMALEDGELPRFLIYRIYGNDMPPLQMKGQLLKNLKYTLENEETNIKGLTKRFVLNRVIDTEIEQEMIKLLASHGYNEAEGTVVRIPFERKGLAQIANDTDALVQYATNLNEVRNELLSTAKNDPAKFHWNLVFDGNQFITREAFAAIVESTMDKGREKEHYFSVPMCRLKYPQNTTWLTKDTKVHELLHSDRCFLQEPQLMFRWNSCQQFDLSNGYGRRSKLQFLSNLGCYRSGGICTEAGYILRLYPFPNDPDHEPLEVIVNHGIRHRVRQQSLARFQDLLHSLRNNALEGEVR